MDARGQVQTTKNIHQRVEELGRFYWKTASTPSMKS